MEGAEQVLTGEKRWAVLTGNSLDMLRSFPDHCVDSIVTDPPAGISFMSAEWDGDKGGRDQWIAWLAEILEEGIRVLKPGGHIFVWSIPRTSHWTGMAVETAGFRIRDKQYHCFGQGFPHGHDVSKAIDKKAGAKREVVGTYRVGGNALTSLKDKGGTYGVGVPNSPAGDLEITAPATDDAKTWEGWNTVLKPAIEEWILAQKPLEHQVPNKKGKLVTKKLSVAECVLEFDTGALNIDGCRVPSGAIAINRLENWSGFGQIKNPDYKPETNTKGRWPANFVLSHCDDCVCTGTKKVPGTSPKVGAAVNRSARDDGYFHGESVGAGYTEPDGTETLLSFECVEGCPVRLLDEQAGRRKSTLTGRADPDVAHDNPSEAETERTIGWSGGKSDKNNSHVYADDGGASRFFNVFYSPKASRAEKEAGLEHFEAKIVNDGRDTPIGNPYQRGDTERKNTHPTVKNLSLMRHLVRLVTPPNGIVLDMFSGSGATGCAAVLEGMRFIGIDLSPEFVDIATARIAHWETQGT